MLEPHISCVTTPAGPGRILLGLLLPSPLQSSPKKGLGICLWMANAIVSNQHTRGFMLSHTLSPLALKAEAQGASSVPFHSWRGQEGEGPVTATPRVWQSWGRTQASDLLV